MYYMTDHKIKDDVYILTATTESLAATVRISAQETTWGQTVSSFDLIASITSKLRRELTLGKAVFSPVKLEVSSKSTDASHPYIQAQNPNYKRPILYIYLYPSYIHVQTYEERE